MGYETAFTGTEVGISVFQRNGFRGGAEDCMQGMDIVWKSIGDLDNDGDVCHRTA